MGNGRGIERNQTTHGNRKETIGTHGKRGAETEGAMKGNKGEKGEHIKEMGRERRTHGKRG